MHQTNGYVTGADVALLVDTIYRFSGGIGLKLTQRDRVLRILSHLGLLEKSISYQRLTKLNDHLREVVEAAPKRDILSAENDKPTVVVNYPYGVYEGGKCKERAREREREREINPTFPVLLQKELVGKLRHGRGRMSFVNGDVYEGDFYNDFMQGKGVMSRTAMDVKYEGMWHRNLLQTRFDEDEECKLRAEEQIEEINRYFLPFISFFFCFFSLLLTVVKLVYEFLIGNINEWEHLETGTKLEPLLEKSATSLQTILENANDRLELSETSNSFFLFFLLFIFIHFSYSSSFISLISLHFS
jgi:hypothetical protein